jgi:hypothetical protein
VSNPPTDSSRLLTVAALREELERLERHGCGDWEIDVCPALSIPNAKEGRPDLAFDVHRYVISGLSVMGDPDPGFILLNFAPATD